LYLNARAIVHVTQAEFLIPGMKKALPGLATFNQVKSFYLFFPQLIFVFAENSDAFDQHQIICEDPQSLITLCLSSLLSHKAAFLPRLTSFSPQPHEIHTIVLSHPFFCPTFEKLLSLIPIQPNGFR
jgi:hypothetical protein